MHRRLTLMLAISIMLLAAACGGGDAPTPTSEPTAIPATDAPEAATEEATEAVMETDATEEVAEETPMPEMTEASTDEASSEEATEAPSTTSPETQADLPLTDAIAVVGFERTTTRSGPGTGFAAVGEVTVNQELPIYAKSGTGPGLWYFVQLPDGQSAWVWSRVVTINPPDAEIPEAENVPSL